MTSPISAGAGDETTHDRGDGAATLRCLIVDDNDHFCQVVGGLLGEEEIAIIGVASTGSEAVRLHDELRPDVALIDVVLGEECGFDLAERLTAATGTGPTTVILMSASLGDEDATHLAACAGAAAFLPKLDISGTAVREIHRRNRGKAGCAASGRCPRRTMAWFYPPPEP